MKVYLPQGIERVTNFLTKQNIKGYHNDKALWLLSAITKMPAAQSGFAEIHTKYLQSFVHNYKAYLDPLYDHRIIECDRHFTYQLHSKARGYKFSDEYSSTLESVEIDYYPIVKKYAKERNFSLASCKANQHLVRWFNPGLAINYDSAVNYLDTYYSEMKLEQEALSEQRAKIKETWYQNYSDKVMDLGLCNPKDSYASYKRAFISIDRIKENDYQLSTDATVNRFHINITAMPSDFRNFLTYEGKQLACLDISNSQAFLSLNLLKKEYIGDILDIADHHIRRDNKLNSNHYLHINYLSSSVILEESLEAIDTQELDSYKNLVLSGTIYDFYSQILQEELGITYSTRKAIKKEFFRTLYSKNGYKGLPKKVFQDHFPGICRYFSVIKKLHPAILPIILQNWESHAVTQVITKKISKYYPEVPQFTIHDGIATTIENVEVLRTIIKAELKNIIGYEPQLKEEVWSINNVKYIKQWKNNQNSRSKFS